MPSDTSLSLSLPLAPLAIPHPPSSLLLSHRPTDRIILILGTGKLAVSRVKASLEAGARPVVLDVSESGTLEKAAEEIQRAVRAGQARWTAAPPELLHRNPTLASGSSIKAVDPAWERGWTALLDELDGDDAEIFAVAITDTLHSGGDDQQAGSLIHTNNGSQSQNGSTTTAAKTATTPLERAKLLARLCRKKRIPINVADQPGLCDFSFPATHRFAATSFLPPGTVGADSASSSTKGPLMSSLQIAVTTNGRGCRLAGRIRRDIVCSLPRNVGDAVERVGEMRELAKRGKAGAENSASTSQPEKNVERATSDAMASSKADEGYFNSVRRSSGKAGGAADVQEDDLNFDSTPLNSPVPQLKTPGTSAPTSPRVTPGHSRRSSGVFSSLLRTVSSKHAAQVSQLTEDHSEEEAERRKRRMRWVAQISEYWPIDYLGSMTMEQMSDALKSFGDEGHKAEQDGKVKIPPPQSATAEATTAVAVGSPESDSRGRSRTLMSEDPHDGTTAPLAPRPRASSQHSLTLMRPPPPTKRKGHIYLIGSGPGHPGLLTLLAYRLLTSPSTDLILSDKLVPSPILNLIPPEVRASRLIIAKKFPGNAEGAQSELISLALQAAVDEGKNVVRLKQGDPFIYGRGGEEVLAFRRSGIEATVIPGISSAIAAPLMLGLPVTQRGAADSMVLCTGVGRGGKKVKLPGYERARTLVVLMGVARLGAVVEILTRGWTSSVASRTSSRSAADDVGSDSHRDADADADRPGQPYPPHTPIAIIERASSPDQRLIASTLSHIVSAIESCGEQRPPGMIVIGWSVLSLQGHSGSGDVEILEDQRRCYEETSSPAEAEAMLENLDRERVARWLDPTSLSGATYVQKEGLDGVYASSLVEFAKGSIVDDVSFNNNGDNAEAPTLPVNVTQASRDEQPEEGKDTETLLRSSTGWAPGRYVPRRSTNGTADAAEGEGEIEGNLAGRGSRGPVPSHGWTEGEQGGGGGGGGGV